MKKKFPLLESKIKSLAFCLVFCFLFSCQITSDGEEIFPKKDESIEYMNNARSGDQDDADPEPPCPSCPPDEGWEY